MVDFHVDFMSMGPLVSDARLAEVGGFSIMMTDQLVQEGQVRCLGDDTLFLKNSKDTHRLKD